MKKNNIYRLNDEIMERVSAGTVKEFEELVSAAAGSPGTAFLAGASVHVPGTNLVSARLFEDFLYTNYNITANISLGYGGTGIGSKANIYVDNATGMRISHAEVCRRLCA